MKLPYVIAISCFKGGVGKSTVALNLAVELAQKHEVTMIDMDYQKSASIFNHNRNEANLDELEIKQVFSDTDLKSELKRNKRLMIIDTGAYDSNLNRLALLHANMIIAPTTDSELDLFGLVAFNKILHDLKKVKKTLNTWVLLNKLLPRATGLKDIEKFILDKKHCFKLLATRLHERSDYKKAFSKGVGVTEIKKSLAGKEIKALAKEIETNVKKFR